MVLAYYRILATLWKHSYTLITSIILVHLPWLHLVLYLNIFPLCCISPLLHSQLRWLPHWIQYTVLCWQLKQFHPLTKTSFLDIRRHPVASSSIDSPCLWFISGHVKNVRLYCHLCAYTMWLCSHMRTHGDSSLLPLLSFTYSMQTLQPRYWG